MAKNSSNIMTNVLLVLLSASVIATIGTIFYHFVDTSYETETAMRTTADESKIFDGVFVRDETLLTYSGNGAVSYQIPDGGKMAVGDTIAEIYSDETVIERERQIEALKQKLEVLERISNPGTLDQAQPADLSRQVTQCYQNIVHSRDIGDLSAAAAYEEQYMEACSTYQIVISKGGVSFGEQIAALSSEIESLKDAETKPIDELTSDTSAYFVSNTDGYEAMLKADAVDEITPERIRQVIAGENAVAQTDNVIGKAIDQYGWYMMGFITNDELKYQVGDAVTLRLLTSSATAPAVIQELRPVEDSDQVMVVLYSENMTSEFVQNRVEHVEMILGEYEGIKVPRKAIRFHDVEVEVTDAEQDEKDVETVNARGVWIQDGEKLEFRMLDVIYEGEDYVISRIHTEDGYLMLYDSIIVEGIDANGN